MRIGSASPRRYLALWMPFLSIDRLRLTRASAQYAARDKRPFVLVEKEGNALRIASADPAALQLGLHAGLALADARARVAELEVWKSERDADHVLLERIADWCDRYTPLVAMDVPDGLLLDITGCAHLFGGERALAQDICTRLNEFGFATKTCVAGTPEAARAVCHYGKQEVILTGREADAVSPLPVAALGFPSEIRDALVRAGLKTIGDLAGRPKTPLSARFGENLARQLRRMLGEEDIRIVPRRPLPDCVVERNFPDPIAKIETVIAVLTRLLEKAAVILEERGEGGRHFETSLFRTDGVVRRVAVETGMPVRDTNILLRLLNERIEALSDPLDPGFGYDLIRLSVHGTQKFEQSQRKLDGGEFREEEFSTLADRLGARFGKHRVLSFSPANSHIPELAERLTPAVHEFPLVEWLSPRPGEPPLRPLHLFDPPQIIETLAEVPDGPPIRFKWRRVTHEVAYAEGPERIAPEWWRRGDDTLTRDYFRIEDSHGRRFWVFREGLYVRETMAPRWFIHGLFA